MTIPEIAPLQVKIDQELRGNAKARVLEAGCGSASHINFPGDSYLIGIDMSEKQLDRNSHLHEKIVGDLQYYELPERSFDAIVCWDVLEHLEFPEKALQKFSRSVKTGGLLVLALPNVLSLKGLITKFTPHSFHVWFYRNYYGSKLAGTGDIGPFPTFLKLTVSPQGIKRFAQDNNFSIDYFDLLEYSSQKRFRGNSAIVNFLFYFLGSVVTIFSLGKISIFNSDCVALLKKLPDSK
jgi:2-polyprenyl-3-methyl-5-hydroxy-6-metoxy-1,4-benzoquinol methylase